MKNSASRSILLGLTLMLSTGFAVCSAQTSDLTNLPPDGISQPAPGENPPGPPPGGMQPTKTANDFTGTYVLDQAAETSQGQNFSADTADQNTILLKNGASLNMNLAALTKSGDTTSDDGSNFNGQNAVFLASDSTALLRNTSLTSSAEGANAVFATGDKSKIIAEHLKIHTTANSSRGLDATYNGTIIASDVDIKTEGAHCAAVATDRGEGNVTVSNSKFATSGEGSPCIYSTGNISINESQGNAAGSEIAVIEGKNSIMLDQADLTGAKKHGIMLYQSFSGDAAEGTAVFRAKDSRLTTTSSGPMFYVTNTNARAVIEHSSLNFTSGILIQAASDHWGNSGSNGGHLTFTAVNQELKGNIIADNISSVDLSLTQKSTLTGAINQDQQAQNAALHLTKASAWDVSADSYLTEFSDEDQTLQNITSNGHTVYYQNNEKNAWLSGKTYDLAGGGKLAPQN